MTNGRFQARRPPLDCRICPLRRLDHITPASRTEIASIARAREGIRFQDAKSTLYIEGDPAPEIFTLYSGWAFTYRMLDDGRRQILRFMLPGDLIGVQPDFTGPADHAAEAITQVALCAFRRDRLRQALLEESELCWHFSWILAHHHAQLREHLTTLGRRHVMERLGFLLLELYERTRQREMHDGTSCPFPLTQSHLGDALGLASAHVSRLLRRLREEGFATLKGGHLEIHDPDALAALSHFDGRHLQPRPLI